MRVLITAWSFPGHINPTMAAARALRARGHEVAFVSGLRAQKTVEKYGFPLLPFRELDEEQVYETVFSDRSSSLLGRAEVLREWLLLTLPAQVADVQRAMEEYRPDVILCDVTVWGPPLVLRELTGVPMAVCSFAPGCMIPSTSTPPWGLGLPSPRTLASKAVCRIARALTERTVSRFRGTADEMRARYGLSPLGIPVHEYLGSFPLYLVPSIRELDYDRRDTPANVHYIGPLIWNDVTAVPVPEWMKGLGEKGPSVHVTEGTMHASRPFLLQATALGLGGLSMDVVMTAGGTRDPGALGLRNLAPNIRLESWVPHVELFKRTDVVVTTGGAGTILTALGAGIPMVISPTEWDKADNAQRFVEAGVAIRISPKRCTPSRLRDAIETVLNDSSYRENARRLAAVLARTDGPASAAELLERTFAPAAAAVSGA